MSAYNDDYDDGPRRYRSTRTRPRERDEPEYVQETTYVERGKGPGPRELVYRGRDDSVEDIQRDFPPPSDRGYRRKVYNDDYVPPPRRAKSVGRGRYEDDYDDDRYSEYAAPAAAAGIAGYAAGRRREKSRRRRDDRDYDSEGSRSPPRREKKERRKSGVGEVLEGLGLGGLAGAVLGGNKDKSGSRSRSRSRRRGKSRSRRGDYSDEDSSDDDRARGGKKDDTQRKWAQAAQAALVAGAVEAFRSRKDPGAWTGEKGRRIATAAIGAGGIDGFIDRDPNKKSKRHLAEAVIGGLAANRIANGPRGKSRTREISPGGSEYGGRSRSRSRSIFGRSSSVGRGRSASRGPGGGGGGGNGIKELVAGGALAAAGKAIYDRVRSKSRKRRSPSNSSSDSYVPSRNRRRDRRRSPPSDTSATESRRSGGGQSTRGGGRDRGLDEGAAAAGAGAGAGAVATRNKGGNDAASQNGGGDAKKGNNNGSGSDSSSTTDMENKRKRMRGKEMLTAGLATIATIHAAHGVYTSMEAHEKRHKLVAEGEMTPEEARKKQTKAWVQDAAAVGIAALGLKGAFSEWKEMNEQRCVSLSSRYRLVTPLLTSTDARSTKSRSANALARRNASGSKSKKSAKIVSEPLRWACHLTRSKQAAKAAAKAVEAIR